MKKKPAVPHFIEQERARGRSDKQIRDKLLEAGWHIDIIHNALKPSRSETVVPGPVKTRYTVKSPFLIAGVLVLLVLLALFI